MVVVAILMASLPIAVGMSWVVGSVASWARYAQMFGYVVEVVLKGRLIRAGNDRASG